jgi:ATP-dependent Lon protease
MIDANTKDPKDQTLDQASDADQIVPSSQEPDVITAAEPTKKNDDNDPQNSAAVLESLNGNQLVLPVVPIREGVLFPSTESVLSFSRSVSVDAVYASTKTQNLVALVTQKKASVNNPGPEDLYTIGTLAIVEKTLKADEEINALVRGIGRIKIVRYLQTSPSLLAQVVKLEDIQVENEETKALAAHLQKEFRRAVHMGKPVEFLNFMKLMGGVTDGELVDQIASTLSIKTKEKQEILETLDVNDRMKKVSEHLAHEMKVLEIEKDVVHKTQEKFDKHMRENVLRERLRTIQKELGELEDDAEVVVDYEMKLKKAKFGPVIREKVGKEIKRLKQMSVNNPEAGYVRSWLDIMFELPWGERTHSHVDLKKAEAVLAKNHYGLKEVKDRILEYIAVLQLKQHNLAQTNKDKEPDKADRAKLPTILCFVGPPGVGKTSIGRSIAEALGREFVKVSLGGVRDEAEIRGHRRTYVGAMPGRIINGIKQAKSMDPVFMLDEVDKIGADFRGDPSAALLEALDPEQNNTFEDHYLDVPFDLSEVLFVTTANTLDTIPAALRDRLEVIRYAGYTEEEKFHIAKEHLYNKVIKVNGLKPEAIQMPNDVFHLLIQRYTREAGVRDLERNLNKVMRKVARQLAEKLPSADGADTAENLESMTDSAVSATKAKKNGLSEKMLSEDQEITPKATTTIKPASAKSTKASSTASSDDIIVIDTAKVKEFLGPEPFDVTLTEAEDRVGLATGLAWTSVGGDVLFIEVALTPGKGQVRLTGKLGDVMKESAQAALTFVKANAKELGISTSALNKTDVHVHVPEGAVPKDGPSAGITITTAIVSAFTKRPVKREIAMTGEVTLRGRVMRIGGLKEKSIAAHRAGSTMVIIPKENERDLVDIPDSVKNDIIFKPVDHVREVLELALA